MAYAKRTPPIKMKVDIDSFNLLVELVNRYTEVDDERISVKSTKMKDKLLRYSVPIEDDEKGTIIDIRLFNNEAEDLIYMLFNNVPNIEIKANYFDVLLKVREEIKNKRAEKE
jgi:hypothetical protein